MRHFPLSGLPPLRKASGRRRPASRYPAELDIHTLLHKLRRQLAELNLRIISLEKFEKRPALAARTRFDRMAGGSANSGKFGNKHAVLSIHVHFLF